MMSRDMFQLSGYARRMVSACFMVLFVSVRERRVHWIMIELILCCDQDSGFKVENI